jgi:hypothetical protein
MSIEEDEDSAPIMSVDPEIRELIGLFDLPAFARRGQDAENSVGWIQGRCRGQREELLEMVRLRLRQWSRVASGPDDWAAAFAGPIEAVWELTETPPPAWAGQSAPPRQQLAVASDLVASLQRFNHRWRQFLETISLGPVNLVIDQYNQYYVLEKECVMGSARLASRHFHPIPRFTLESLLRDYPLLPVPDLARRRAH